MIFEESTTIGEWCFETEWGVNLIRMYTREVETRRRRGGEKEEEQDDRTKENEKEK